MRTPIIKSYAQRYGAALLCAALVGIALLAPGALAHAATPTPIPPTATMVPIDIPINTLMESANNWLTTFAPIAAIGIGISIALAVLGYLGHMIKSAFT